MAQIGEAQTIEVRYPPFRMTAVGRLTVRIISVSAELILFAAAILMLLGELRPLRAAGILIPFLLIDLFKARKRGQKALPHLPPAAAGKPKTKTINAAQYAAPSALHLLERALDANAVGDDSFELTLLSLALRRREIREALRRMDKKPDDITAKIKEHRAQTEVSAAGADARARRAEALLAAAFARTKAAGGDYIEPKDIVGAVLRSEELSIQKINRLFDLNPDDLEVAMAFAKLRAQTRRRAGFLPRALIGFAGSAHKKRLRQMNRAWTARPTPFLNRFGTDLTALAEENAVGLLIGHEKEYSRLVDILARPGRANVLLIGDPGAGKTTLLEHLAYEIKRDRVPKPLFDKRLISIDVATITAGAADAEAEGRVQTMIAEASRAGNVILHIPNIETMLRGGAGRASYAEVIIPALQSDAISIIGDTTPKKYKEAFEGEAGMGEHFEAVRMEELSELEAVRYLSYEALILEAKYKIIITLGALKEAVAIAHKYFRAKLLPSSASDLLREALAMAVGQGKKEMTVADIVAAAERRTNIPLETASGGEAEKLLAFEKEVHTRFIDQEEAVSAVARALREYRAGLSRKGGPLATFLFVGPTGVGKTELSKQVARLQFGSEKAMVRLDMSEYQNRENIYQLIGSPKGEIGGALTDAVSEKPYSLILLDEFEKAHPDILNLFLQVFDDGRLTDSIGRTVDFQNTIIIATSNAHSNFIKEEIEKGTPYAALAEDIKKKLAEFFKPELLNRFSGIVVFKPLRREDITAIAQLMAVDLAETVDEASGIELTIEELALEKLAELGFDPVFGARPLRGVFSEKIKSVLAEKILKEEIKRGAAVAVAFRDGGFEFKITGD